MFTINVDFFYHPLHNSKKTYEKFIESDRRDMIVFMEWHVP